MTRSKRPTQNGITPPPVFNLSGTSGLSRDIWQDRTTPKTDKPVRFLPAHIRDNGTLYLCRAFGSRVARIA